MMFYLKRFGGSMCRRPPDDIPNGGPSNDGAAQDEKKMLEEIFPPTGLPQIVIDRLRYYRDLAAQFGGFEIPNVREYAERYANSHPLFSQLAEAMRLRNEKWKSRVSSKGDDRGPQL